MNRNKKPNFNDYEQGPDFDRARSLIATPFEYIDIKLDSAIDKQIFNVSGDFLYFDAASTGYCTVELNNQWNDPAAPFLAQPGFALEAIFKQVKITAPAQVGKFMRLMYSTGARVAPTNSTTINGSVTVADSGFVYASSFKSVAALVANTAETIFSAAANTNGAILWRASFSVYTAGSGTVSQPCMVAKAGAPSSPMDGDVIVSPDSMSLGISNHLVMSGKLDKPVRIPAGKGLYMIDCLASDGIFLLPRSALYTLL